MTTPAPNEIVSDQELNDVCVNADFGGADKRDVLNNAVLKVACQFYSGSVVEAMLQQHSLADMSTYELTIKGKAYLWAVYGKQL